MWQPKIGFKRPIWNKSKLKVYSFDILRVGSMILDNP